LALEVAASDAKDAFSYQSPNNWSSSQLITPEGGRLSGNGAAPGAATQPALWL